MNSNESAITGDELSVSNLLHNMRFAFDPKACLTLRADESDPNRHANARAPSPHARTHTHTGPYSRVDLRGMVCCNSDKI